MYLCPCFRHEWQMLLKKSSKENLKNTSAFSDIGMFSANWTWNENFHPFWHFIPNELSGGANFEKQTKADVVAALKLWIRPEAITSQKKHLFWIFPTFLKLFDGEDCDSLWRERGGLTNQVDKGDKVAKEGAGKSESPDHKPVMKASNNLQCQCCCLHLM